MTSVVDASLIAKIYLPDEFPTDAERVSFERAFAGHVVVPPIFPLEVHNLFVMSERRERISAARGDQLREAFGALAYVVDDSPALFVMRETVRLARLHKLTVYDASYLELAIRIDALLVSVDKALVRAAGAEDVAL